MTAQKEAPLPNHTKSIDSAMLSSVPHPLEPLSIAEFEKARQCIISALGDDVIIKFRAIYLKEPPKHELVLFLEAEHSTGIDSHTPRPARLAMVLYDVVRSDKSHEYTHSIVDLSSGKEKEHRVIDKMHQAALMM
jgi:primary-amine oxidase